VFKAKDAIKGPLMVTWGINPIFEKYKKRLCNFFLLAA
jgi:hypothetical protein